MEVLACRNGPSDTSDSTEPCTDAAEDAGDAQRYSGTDAVARASRAGDGTRGGERPERSDCGTEISTAGHWMHMAAWASVGETPYSLALAPFSGSYPPYIEGLLAALAFPVRRTARQELPRMIVGQP